MTIGYGITHKNTKHIGTVELKLSHKNKNIKYKEGSYEVLRYFK
jgi:hypothetical protein